MKKIFSIKYSKINKLLSMLVILGVLFGLTPSVHASALEDVTPSPSPLTIDVDNNIQNGESLQNIITPQDIVSPSLNIDISERWGLITANWTYKSRLGSVTFVNLVMTLQYRENFLQSWEDVETKSFVYSGGQGTIEQNQANFSSKGEGTYRVIMSGTVAATKGGSLIKDRPSKSIKVDTGLIISSPQK